MKDYDLVINDFEPVTAWACKLRKKKIGCAESSISILSPKTPIISGIHLGAIILKIMLQLLIKVGFHFERYDDFIRTPVIRSEIRNLKPENLGHYTVYLPAYSDEFILKKNYQNIQTKISSFF